MPGPGDLAVTSQVGYRECVRDLQQYLAPIDSAEEQMLESVIRLSSHNSGSFNLAGLAQTLDLAMEMFEPLAEKAERLDLPPLETISDQGQRQETPLGQAGRLITRPDAPIQVLCVGHYDTVFGPDHPFQEVHVSEPGILNGPGVADMKGGLVIMQAALAALEDSPWASNVGWEIILNPDEELGSLCSASLLARSAQHKDVGFVFEPTFPNGNLASERKGSGTFHLISRGRSAHAGRDHHLGRNAISGLADAIVKVQALNGRWPDTTFNVGYVHGGGATNIVPDTAVAKLNVRVPTAEVGEEAIAALQAIATGVDARDVAIELGGTFTRPPKPLTGRGRRLLEFVAATGRDLGLDLGWEPTGGVSDGNNLAAAGLPNVDNIGVRGGNIHSAEEYLVIESLTERSKLAAGVLLNLAAGEFDPKEHA